MDILGYKVYSEGNLTFSKELKGVINTINPHSYVVAKKDEVFRKALRASDILIPDGIGFVLAAMILKGKRIKRIPGYELHEEIINKIDKYQGSCFYLGSSDFVLAKIKERLLIEHPDIKVGSYSPPFIPFFNNEEILRMINAVNNFKPDVLFLGMTAPKQEKWVFENKVHLKVPLICSIGAVFDFYAGSVKRPGKFWISIGIEWLPRLIKQPFRLWKRTFISAPQFLFFVLYEKAKGLFKVQNKARNGWIC